MRVLVVSYAPADGRAATGGFDWFPWSADGFDAAQQRLRQHIEDAADDPALHAFTFVPVEVPDAAAYALMYGRGTVLDRDAVTRWLENEHPLFEVGLPRETDTTEKCVIYGCDDQAEKMMTFALPGGATVERRVCWGHARTLEVEGTEGFDFALRDEEAEVELRPRPASEAPRQTRPSPILRRPDPETPISETTTAELLFEARDRIHGHLDAVPDTPDVVYDLRRARDAIEDAISLHNRAVYRERGVFAITDAERLPEQKPRTADDDRAAFERGRASGAHLSLHDEFARCPECGNATVGLAPPYSINHAAQCGAPVRLRSREA